MAQELGMSKSTYSRLERGERSPTSDERRKLATILDTSEEQVTSLWMRAHRRPGGSR
ncbi:helix-turn-helix domain-containing protein [Rhodococcus ruber]|uniref:helix-turn-helix domain-containing protein n=1 Tax=Rhodococcus ruber TaxID=1830 RepID=UPI003452F20A